jgi:hypothetical protein
MEARRLAIAVAFMLMPLGAPAAANGTAIGEARPVAGLASASGVNAALRWVGLANGAHVAALRISSPGAKGLRVGLRLGAIDPSAKLRFSSPDENGDAALSAAGVIEALARNRASGESGPDARTWWSPLVKGDTLVLEIELPPGADPQALRLAVPLASHLRAWPGEDGDAVAIATVQGATLECPGALVEGARDAASIAYFVTGSRCVATQSAASSLQAFWPGAASRVGARLLRASAESGTAFVALDGPPAAAPRLAASAAVAADPALEQWLGAPAARAVGAIDTFSFR